MATETLPAGRFTGGTRAVLRLLAALCALLGPAWPPMLAADARAAASQAAAARARGAPAHSPYRQGGGSPPFADVQRQPPLLGVGSMGAFLMF